MIRTLTIIGNGFDLGHKLPTRFDDFIDSTPDVYGPKYQIFRGEDNSWNSIESRYEHLLRNIMENRCEHDLSEEVERIQDEYGLNEYGEINLYGYSFEAYDEEFEKITEYISLLRDFETDFLTYLNIFCNDSILKNITRKQPIARIINQSDRIITFNYTHTAEVVYDAKNTIHIHGDIDDSIAIGSGALEDAKTSALGSEYPTKRSFRKDKDGLIDMMRYYTEDMDGHWVEDHFVKRFFDGVVTEAEQRENELFDLLDVKSKDSLAERQDVLDMLKEEHFDVVYILGHSLGAADYKIFDAINKDAYIVYFYHSDKDYTEREAVLKKLGLNFEMVSDEKIFCS